jgi:uncharacterized cupredoxin-like copper-binding protein
MRRAALAILVVLVAGGCSAGGGHSDGTSTSVRISERDFKISAAAYQLRAGDTDLSVRNSGPDAHELIVVRETDTGMPLRPDGLTIDEDAVERTTVGALEPGQPGGVRHLRVHLIPGRYLLFCNMAGHYLGGMHTELVVR